MPRQQYDSPEDISSAPSATADSQPHNVAAGDLRSVERLLASLQTPLDDPFILPRREPTAPARNLPQNLTTWSPPPMPAPPEQRGGLLSWLFLSLGLMALACGGVMLIWSVVVGREDLWSLGIPLALGGQGAIIFGLIGLAEAATQRCKQATAALEEHRQRLLLMQELAAVNQTPRRAA